MANLIYKDAPAEDSELYEEYCRKHHIYYTKYSDYISINGTTYIKDDAEFVPNEELVPYIKHMGYTKFKTNYATIKLDKKKLRAVMHKYADFFPISGENKWANPEIMHKELTKTIYLRGMDVIYAKIYDLMLSGVQVLMYRPSYIYTSTFLVGPDCGYETDDLEEEKYSGRGTVIVSYNKNQFNLEEDDEDDV
jgi:hypothetical protein